MSIEPSALQLKASFYTITVLQCNDCNLGVIEATLQQWISNTPQLLKGMPLIVDLPQEAGGSSDVQAIIECLRRYGLIPIGIQGGSAEDQNKARALHLAVFSRQKRDTSQPNTASSKNSTQKVEATLLAPTIIESVRSGQQVNVKGDLIVLQSVSLGAEVSAEGNIHIYGALKGRAFAGSKGNKKASIFCHKVEAELVAIAGCYWQYDDLHKSLDKTNLQIYLANESLHTRLLG